MVTSISPGFERGAAPDQRNARNQTPLAGVAFKGGLSIAKLLVKHGADPNADQGGGRYPVQFAAMFGNPDIVEFLNSLQPATKPSFSLGLLARATGIIRRRILPLFKAHWSPPGGALSFPVGVATMVTHRGLVIPENIGMVAGTCLF